MVNQHDTNSAIPEGIKGWSWGAFLLNWVWAIGNRTWIGLLALIPIAGLLMLFVLGFKGREWAWKNKTWDSIDHFNHVQQRWSWWGVVFAMSSLVLSSVLIAIPAYDDYQKGIMVAESIEQPKVNGQSIVEQTVDSKALNWNKTDADIVSNGNLELAAQAIKSLSAANGIQDNDPALVIKAPWKYYGQLLCYSGTADIAEDQPPQSDLAKLLQTDDVGEIVFRHADGTILDFFVMGGTKTAKAGDEVSLCGLPIGRTEAPNAVGGTFTHLVFVALPITTSNSALNSQKPSDTSIPNITTGNQKAAQLIFKGLFLGMPIEEASQIINQKLGKQLLVVSTNPESHLKQTSLASAPMGMPAAMTGIPDKKYAEILANTSGKVTSFLFSREILDVLFETKGMSQDDFMQTFSNAYAIPLLEPDQRDLKVNALGISRTIGFQIVYSYRSPVGFELNFFDEPRIIDEELANQARVIGMTDYNEAGSMLLRAIDTAKVVESKFN